MAQDDVTIGAFMEFFKNPKDFQNKLAEFKKVQEQANKKLNESEKLEAATTVLVREQTAERIKLEEDQRKLLETTQARDEEQRTKEEEFSQKRDFLDEREKGLQAREVAAREMEDSAQKNNATAEALLSDAKGDRAEAAALRADYDEKISRLKAAME